MNNRFKYITAILLLFISLSSYSQRLLLETDATGRKMMVIDTYGMNKDILAVTEEEQGLRKGKDGGTKDFSDDVFGINSFVNMIVSGKYEIYSSDFTGVAYKDARARCAGILPTGAWRVPTLNESLLMVMFYEQMKDLKPTGFTLPSGEPYALYVTATAISSTNYFYYYWRLTLWNTDPGRAPITGYYGDSSRTQDFYHLRCIRDIPQ